MKRSLMVLPSLGALAFALVACGSPAPVGVTTPSAATLPAAEKAAEPAPAATTKESLDPLAVDGALEAAMVPTVEQTPKKQLRRKSRGDLASAMSALSRASTPEGAVKSVTARLGKPTWIENGKKRVWIADDGKSCHRFVLDADGQADLETASSTDWRMLSATAHQNACTGEIRRGAL